MVVKLFLKDGNFYIAIVFANALHIATQEHFSKASLNQNRFQHANTSQSTVTGLLLIGIFTTKRLPFLFLGIPLMFQ